MMATSELTATFIFIGFFWGAISCPCGLENLSPRIVNGETVKAHRYPWMAAIANPMYGPTKDAVECGGALINDQYIVTAAHCVYQYKYNEIKVVLGAHDLSKVSPSEQLAVAEIKVHEYWNNRTNRDDLAVLKLANRVEFSDKVRPICLPPAGAFDYDMDALFVAGWGALKGRSDLYPDELMEVTLPEVGNFYCRNIHYRNPPNPMYQLCAGKGEGGRDSCNGDSGGPLAVRKNGKVYQVGVVSYGSIDCGTRFNPGVYTRITGYLKWILDNTRDAKSCPL